MSWIFSAKCEGFLWYILIKPFNLKIYLNIVKSEKPSPDKDIALYRQHCAILHNIYTYISVYNRSQVKNIYIASSFHYLVSII